MNPQRKHWMVTLQEVFYPALAVVGIPSNTIAFLIIWRRSCMLSRSSTFYLMAMAVADNFVLIFIVILELSVKYHQQEPFWSYDPWCSLRDIFNYGAYNASTVNKVTPLLRSRKRKSVVLLVTVSMTFLLLSVTRAITQIILRTTHMYSFDRDDYSLRINVAADTGTMLSLSNAAANMYLYVCTQSKFRQEFLACLRQLLNTSADLICDCFTGAQFLLHMPLSLLFSVLNCPLLHIILTFISIHLFSFILCIRPDAGIYRNVNILKRRVIKSGSGASGTNMSFTSSTVGTA
ncbi:hypothetical protein INR49_013372, partial [Caranx melampygus]